VPFIVVIAIDICICVAFVASIWKIRKRAVWLTLMSALCSFIGYLLHVLSVISFWHLLTAWIVARSGPQKLPAGDGASIIFHIMFWGPAFAILLLLVGAGIGFLSRGQCEFSPMSGSGGLHPTDENPYATRQQ